MGMMGEALFENKGFVTKGSILHRECWKSALVDVTYLQVFFTKMFRHYRICTFEHYWLKLFSCM